MSRKVYPIVPDARGGMIFSAKEQGAESPAPIITRNAAYWEGRIFDFDVPTFVGDGADWQRTCEIGAKVTVNMRGVRLYVNSVSGATESSDTGDGTEENPFSCFNSALRWLERSLYRLRTEIQYLAATTGCSCSDRNFGIQIYLSGVVDYPIIHLSFGPRFPAIQVVGNGRAEIRTGVEGLQDWVFYRDFKNCLIEAEWFGLFTSGYPTVYENCEIHALSGDSEYAPSIFSNCDIYLEVDPEKGDDQWFGFGTLRDNTTLHANSIAYEDDDPCYIDVFIYKGQYSIVGPYANYVYMRSFCS